MKKRLLVVLFLGAAFFITSCWDLTEIEKLAEVVTVGVDVGTNKKYEVTNRIARPSQLVGHVQGGSEGGKEPFFVTSAQGESFFDAVRMSLQHLPRRVFYGNVRNVVIGEELAKKGVRPIFDFLERDGETRRNVKIFIARGEAKSIINAQPQLSNVFSPLLEGLVQFQDRISISPLATIGDFISDINSPGKDPIAPIVQLTKRMPETGNPEEVRLYGAAIFKDDKLVGYFDDEEARGYLWAAGKVKAGLEFANITEDKNFTFEITRACSNISVDIEDGDIIAKIKILTEGIVAEMSENMDLDDPEEVRKFENEINRVIKEKIEKALHKLQWEYNSDPLGIGEYVFREYPRLWKSELESIWYEIYPTVKFEIMVDAHFRKQGLIIEY